MTRVTRCTRHTWCWLAGAIACASVAIAKPPDQPIDHEKIRPLTPHAQLGSWEQSIKKSTDAESDDAESTVEALLATNQDFHIYQIDSETDWEDFQELVAAASGTGLKIYAAMDSPSQNYESSRWFDTDGDGDIGDTPPPGQTCAATYGYGLDAWECQRDYMRYWIDAWVRAARDLSALSVDYPDTLVGFAINDLMDYIEQPAFPQCMDGLRLSKSELARNYDACHQAPGSTLGFYPVITYPSIGAFISPGYILGTDYGVRMSDTDEMTLRFDVALLASPIAAKLTYFQSTFSADDDVIRSLWVGKNGMPPAELCSQPLYAVDRPEVEFATRMLDLDTGNNRIEFKLYALPTYDDGCGNLVTPGCGLAGDWWQIWNVKLEYWVEWGDGIAHFEVPLTPRFFSTADPDDYCAQGTCAGPWFDLYTTLNNNDCRCHVSGDCTPFLPDSAVQGRLATRLVCGPNDAYLIQDVIDGVVPYSTSTDLHGDADALDPKLHFARLLQAAKRDLGDDKLITMQTAFTGVELDTDVMVNRVRVAAMIADGVGVYRFPLSMYFMNPSDRRGIFAESPTVAGYKMAQWPTDQAILPGWYQRWVHHPASGSPVDMVVDMSDGRTSSSNAGQFLKSVRGGGLAAPYEVDPFADGIDIDTIPDHGYLTSTVVDPVILQLHTTGGTSIYLQVFFHATDSTKADVTDWTFESGVDDPHTIDVYDRLIAVYKLLHWP
ncbi:MAG: hypothetical protein JNL50_11025 [Phycisphaerae bacterium]|nr:hypothetical protein [Phycisphaerae bacterium]